ncbi:MAG: hypothetical protein ACRDN0_13415 [Trebonia sp.]
MDIDAAPGGAAGRHLRTAVRAQAAHGDQRGTPGRGYPRALRAIKDYGYLPLPAGQCGQPG